MRIGLLELDHVDDRNRDVAGDYSDMFAELLTGVAPEVGLIRYDAVAGEAPGSPDDCDAWLATGSRRSVYEDVEWIETAAAFVRNVREAGARYVGVCFGHQLLAQALGGRVERSAQGWGVGAHLLAVRDTEEWMRPPKGEANLLFMHQDQVTRLPDGAVLLASTNHCPIAMFRVGATMLGMQAHPEFAPAYLSRLLDERVGRIGDDQTKVARAGLGARLDRELVAGWIVRFLASAEVREGSR